MALIKCPECNKEVSDKADVCIHCGYPLHDKSIASIINARSKKVILPSFKEYSNKKISVLKIVREITGKSLSDAVCLIEQDVPIIKDGISLNQANDIVEKFKKIDVKVEVFDSETPLVYISPLKDRDRICCPKCGSLEYHVGSRGYGLFRGFIGSGQVIMTCLKCGNTWKPNR